MSDNTEIDAKSVKQALDSINDQVKEFVNSQKGAIEDGAKLSRSAKETADQLLSQQGEIKNRLLDVEQLVAKMDRPAATDEPETFAAAFQKALEEDNDLKEAIIRPRQGKQVNIPVSRKSLTNSGVTGAALNYPGQQISGLVAPLVRRLTIRDLLMPGSTNAAAVFYPRESGYTNNAAIVSEGSLKPTSEITAELVTEAVRTIAHTQDISLQMLADVPYLQSYIQNRMLYSLKLIEEGQLFTGSGTGGNIEGIYTAATAYANTTSLANETNIDKLRLALLQVELAFAEVTGIVLNPADWAGIELLKDTTGRYIFSNPQDAGQARLWGRPVVSTQACTAGRFLVGDFAAHAQILDREDANVAISFENKDNFVRNMATIRVEERLALAIYRPEAFIKGRLESATGPNANP